MRDFFIGSLEIFDNIVVVVAGVAIVLTALSVLAFGGGAGFYPPGFRLFAFGSGRFMMSLGILIMGFIWLTLFAGTLYLGLGIYRNTKRMADLLEERR